MVSPANFEEQHPLAKSSLVRVPKAELNQHSCTGQTRTGTLNVVFMGCLSLREGLRRIVNISQHFASGCRAGSGLLGPVQAKDDMVRPSLGSSS